jgi:hypothetical protein
VAGLPALANVQGIGGCRSSTSWSQDARNFTNTARMEVSFGQAGADETGCRFVCSDQFAIFMIRVSWCVPICEGEERMFCACRLLTATDHLFERIE